MQTALVEGGCIGLMRRGRDRGRALAELRAERGEAGSPGAERRHGRQQREAKDQRLLDSGSVAPKEMTNLQHELETLKRRQSDLEDQELELMERLEVAETALATATQGREKAEADLERATQLRDDALADITDATSRHEAARAEVVGALPEHLLALYEKIRAQTGSTGAAMLKARQCQGCRLELYGNELSAVRNADPHEVVRCENCGRILVRTAESGL